MIDKEQGFWSEGVDGALAKTSGVLPETKFGIVTSEETCGAVGFARSRADRHCRLPHGWGPRSIPTGGTVALPGKVKAARLHLNSSAPVKDLTAIGRD